MHGINDPIHDNHILITSIHARPIPYIQSIGRNWIKIETVVLYLGSRSIRYRLLLFFHSFFVPLAALVATSINFISSIFFHFSIRMLLFLARSLSFFYYFIIIYYLLLLLDVRMIRRAGANVQQHRIAAESNLRWCNGLARSCWHRISRIRFHSYLKCIIFIYTQQLCWPFALATMCAVIIYQFGLWDWDAQILLLFFCCYYYCSSRPILTLFSSFAVRSAISYEHIHTWHASLFSAIRAPHTKFPSNRNPSKRIKCSAAFAQYGRKKSWMRAHSIRTNKNIRFWYSSWFNFVFFFTY